MSSPKSLTRTSPQSQYSTGFYLSNNSSQVNLKINGVVMAQLDYETAKIGW